MIENNPEHANTESSYSNLITESVDDANEYMAEKPGYLGKATDYLKGVFVAGLASILPLMGCGSDSTNLQELQKVNGEPVAVGYKENSNDWFESDKFSVIVEDENGKKKYGTQYGGSDGINAEKAAKWLRAERDDGDNDDVTLYMEDQEVDKVVIEGEILE